MGLWGHLRTKVCGCPLLIACRSRISTSGLYPDLLRHANVGRYFTLCFSQLHFLSHLFDDLVNRHYFLCIYFYMPIYDVGVNSTWLWYALKLAGFFLFAVLMTCYWTFIDQYHHLQDAKRMYSLFSSTIFLGAASTGLLMHSGLLDLKHLIALIIGLFSFTYFWVCKISKDMPLIAHEDAEQEGQIYEQGNYLKFFIKSILSSPFTLLLMASNLSIYLLLVITEYNYMFTFENYFDAQPSDIGGGTEADLTLFLGKWLASVSVCNLIFGLFIYSRLIRRFGIGSMLFITPVELETELAVEPIRTLCERLDSEVPGRLCPEDLIGIVGVDLDVEPLSTQRGHGAGCKRAVSVDVSVQRHEVVRRRAEALFVAVEATELDRAASLELRRGLPPPHRNCVRPRRRRSRGPRRTAPGLRRRRSRCRRSRTTNTAPAASVLRLCARDPR